VTELDDRRNPDPGSGATEEQSHNPWLKRAQDAYTTSTDYCRTNIWRQWRKNLSHFRNQHDYATEFAHKGYVGRSKIFRPKTRASLRSAEAAFARSLFSNQELVNITAENSNDDQQRASAAIVKEILQYRLTKKLQWYLTVMGAYQDSNNYGITISKQYWDYDSHTESWEEPVVDNGEGVLDADGQPAKEKRERLVVDSDDLRIDLLAPENFRFSPMADWRDPVGTSPYLIELIPMYAGEVQEKMQTLDDKTGQPQWMSYTLEQILTTSGDEFNEVRRAREGYKRTDPVDYDVGNEYTTVWVHHNIVRHNGIDWMYFTLGTQLMLTEPRPLAEIYETGRPYVVGISILEAHRNFPAGANELAAPMQQELNQLVNQRIDNVKLVLNKRYFVQRGKQVDLNALKRSIPGSGVFMNDVNAVKAVDTQDVTSSSYTEQDRLSVEMDELIGNFSQASVQSNRNLNETVGGMDKMTDSANAVQEYTIRTFIETWVEPVLRQCVKLIQLYETDKTVVALCAKNAQLFQKFGVTKVTDQMLLNGMTTTVNVGINNTDPTRRVNKFMLGINTAMALPGAAQRLDTGSVIEELFSNLGYQNGSRFFSPEEEASQPSPPDPKMEEIKARMQMAEQENQLKMQQIQQEMEIAQARLQNDREVALMKLALEKDLKLSDMQTKLGLQQQQYDQKERQIQTTRDVAALREQNRLTDIDWKNRFAEAKYGSNERI
jgi:hypothetical protein